MEQINQISQHQTNKVVGLAVHIEGDKSGFVSKAAIDKFKTGIKSTQLYNLEDLINKYVKSEFQLTQVSKSETEVKFSLVEKPKAKQPVIINDSKQKLREKLREKYNKIVQLMKLNILLVKKIHLS